MAVQERGPEAGPDAVPASSATAPVPAASGLATAGWRGARAVMARADRPAVPGLIMLLAATGFVLARWSLWARHSIGRFILSCSPCVRAVPAWPPACSPSPC